MPDRIEEIIKSYDADDGLYELRIERVVKKIEAEFKKRVPKKKNASNLSRDAMHYVDGFNQCIDEIERGER
jgi:hypothetical protein